MWLVLLVLHRDGPRRCGNIPDRADDDSACRADAHGAAGATYAYSCEVEVRRAEGGDAERSACERPGAAHRADDDDTRLPAPHHDARLAAPDHDTGPVRAWMHPAGRERRRCRFGQHGRAVGRRRLPLAA